MFKAKGDCAQWRTVYDHISQMRVGQVLKDGELRALLPDAAESSLFGAVHRAVKELEEEHKRTLDRVRGVGYRMVAANEHERLARGQHKRARRSLKRAWRKAHSADRSQLTPDERRRLDAVEEHIGQQQEMIGRLQGSVARLDDGLKQARRDQRKDAAQLSERVDRLTELLERHGITDTTERVASS